jgi:acetyl esterase/lipase
VLTRAAELAAPEARRRALIAELDRLGVDRIYSEYWTCNNVIFLTRERIVCAVLADDLTPGWDRYPPYRALVRTASQPPAYVLPAGTAQAEAVADRLARTGVPVRTHRVAGYDIHRPAAPVDLTTR